MTASLAAELKSLKFNIGTAEAFQNWQRDFAPSAPAALEPMLAPVFSASPFLLDCACKEADWLLEAFDAPFDATIETLLTSTDQLGQQQDEAELSRQLRQNKRRLALIAALAEVGQATKTATTTSALALFADRSLDAILDFLARDLANQGKFELREDQRPAAQLGICVFALGKHGGLELNYSSDIDIVVFFDPDRSPLVDDPRHARIYEKLVRHLVALMQDRDEHGYVFRTDLRLRPDPGSTPAIISTRAAMTYYESRGQNWERAAWIKARPCAGDLDAGHAFLKELTPFIWRKHLDYATIDDIRAIKRQINVAKNIVGREVYGHNVKLGFGGIREIEFFAQTQQLIAGGREPGLRTRSTADTLDALADCNWISSKIADELEENYWFLRAVENRVQMLNDEQTHQLGDNDKAIAPIASLMNFDDIESFKSAYQHCLVRVVGHYGELFSDDGDEQLAHKLVFTGSDDDPDTWQALSDMGFRDPTNAITTIKKWHYASYPATRADKARQNLTALVPHLLHSLSNARNADEALNRFDIFLSKLPAGVQLFALLRNNERLRHLLVDFMASAPRMTDAILRRVHIVDGLIDPAFYDEIPTVAALTEKANDFLGEARNYEDLIDRSRIFGQEQIFLTSAGLIAGTVKPEQATEQFSALAQNLMEWLFEGVRREFEQKHGKVPGAQVALLAFGKLASAEMSATSDLDFILLYDAPKGSDGSDGKRPLETPHYFTRLTQRLVAALSAPTAEGVLYETDMRLRPSGNAGPLATSFKGFNRYQHKEAWTWEHMALSRARVVFSDGDLGDRIHGVISDALNASRDKQKLVDDVWDMRGRIEKDRQAKSVWDLKLAVGGVIDLEFIVQFAQLAYGDQLAVPQAPPQTVFTRLAETGLLPEALELKEIHAEFTAVLQLMSACLNEPLKVESWSEGFKELLIRVTHFPSLDALETDLKDKKQRVRALMEQFIVV
ncbi:bifunctional [glutamine synthetase] adenylyltransferase/[glutamine synthetase]-adenylyl-L-tyrosine phosphorylase [Maritalea sp. S77]|uniref:bifunctional [glutamine synthetase] adenylyltransferase/[glutamine synthetase]-adenylyl-L-tyrosine phosphorylase n=1 Tax=Maritalea sp. S77 TaxID=3415125 RepID=UPI003C7C15D6